MPVRDLTLSQRRKVSHEIAKEYSAWKRRLRRDPSADERRQIVAIGFQKAKVQSNPEMITEVCGIQSNYITTLPETVIPTMFNRNPVPMKVGDWRVTHDGETVAKVKSETEAWQWLHRRQGQSIDYAVRYGGYDVVQMKDGEVYWSYRREMPPQPNPSLAASMAGAVVGSMVATALNPGSVCPKDRNGHYWAPVDYHVHDDPSAPCERGCTTINRCRWCGAEASSAEVNPASGPADETAARELELFITNDADLYRQQFIPIVRNLMRKRRAGTFDPELSVKLWMYLVDNGARKYVHDHGTPGQKIDAMFNRNTRLAVAKSLAEDFIVEAGYGNYDNEACDPTFRPNPIPGAYPGEKREYSIRCFAEAQGTWTNEGAASVAKYLVETRADDATVHEIVKGGQHAWVQKVKAFAKARKIPPLQMNPLLMTITGNPGPQSNPMRRRRDPFARMEYIPVKSSAECSECGGRPAYTIVIESDGGRRNQMKGAFCSWSCAEAYSGGSIGNNPQSNPTRSRGKKVTMTLKEFAAKVKAMNNPALWQNFLAKLKGYQKWSHGTLPTKVTVEMVATPGVSGLMITYDAGTSPESTYIMPDGTNRKGAWKHPWDTPTSVKHDPEAGLIIQKLHGKSKITDFYHH